MMDPPTPQCHCCHCTLRRDLIAQLAEGCTHTATRSCTEPPAHDVTQHIYHVRAPNQLHHEHLELSQANNALSATLTNLNAQSTTSTAVTGTPNSLQSHDHGRPRQTTTRRASFPVRHCSWFHPSCATTHRYLKHFANHYRDKHLSHHWNWVNNAYWCCNIEFFPDGKELIEHVWELHLALSHRSVTMAG